MPEYRNGYIPDNLLVKFDWKRGPNDGNPADGDWHHSLSPATLAKHNALVARARQRTGRELQITRGWSAYRPYDAQVLARRVHGIGAAVPGTSSHGGVWEGRQTLAMDYGNWSWVYDGNRAAFYEDARAVGLTPGMIEPSRGYPDEPWHIIDLDPWGAIPAGLVDESEDDMPLNDEDKKWLKAEIAKAVWNYQTGADGKSGVNNEPAWKRLSRAEASAGWVKTRIGGSHTGTTITDMVQWLKDRIGGSYKGPTVAAELNDLNRNDS